MKRTILLKIYISCFIILLSSCGNNKQDNLSKSSTKQADESTNQEVAGLKAEFLGNYHGIQPSYYMKNQFGDDMVINGNKVSVPSIDYKFLLKENNVVNLQQISLEDNSRVYYNGKYKVISEDDATIKIECFLSDSKGSNPTYTLTLYSSNKEGVCSGSNEPEFSIAKK
jgi:protein involved in sex pheromone biosynthesis